MAIASLVRKTLTEALKARDTVRLSAARLAQAALKNREIEKRGPLSETEAEAVIAHLAKQRREAIEQFRKGKREDLASREEAELKFLEGLLPQLLSREEIAREVEGVIAATGASGPQDIGKVMKPVMAKLSGRADGSLVRQIVQEKLQGS